MKSKFFASQKIMDNVTMIAGLAGELAQARRGAEGMTASDTVAHLPEAIQTVKNA